MNCPECDAVIDVPGDAASGEIVSCPDCGADYEISVKDGSKMELKKAESIGEDWGMSDALANRRKITKSIWVCNVCL